MTRNASAPLPAPASAGVPAPGPPALPALEPSALPVPEPLALPPQVALAAGAALAARCEAATKIYGRGDLRVTALAEVTVGFERGRFTAIMGPSGSGKSTLMQCMAGLDRLDGGVTFVGDTELGRCNDKQLTALRRDRLGFIFQAFNLIPTLSTLENITLPASLAGRRPDQGWLTSVIDAVGLGDRLTHRPAELSGGQQQRVAVARALATGPELIFADEPTGNLDSSASREILAFMQLVVQQLGQTIVMVTHDPVAAAHADRILFFQDGRVVDELRNPTGAQAVLDRLVSTGV